MPQLGETVTEGTITRWLKQVGDRVEADEPLFEVSTDKVDSEVPAPVGGVVTEILVPEGETVEVGTRLGGVGRSTFGSGFRSARGCAGRVRRGRHGDRPQRPWLRLPRSRRPWCSTPVERRPRPSPCAVAPEQVTAAPPVAPASDPDRLDPPLTSPIVRRLVAERGLDARSIQGSGPGGRLTRKDVLDAAALASNRPNSAPPADSARGVARGRHGDACFGSARGCAGRVRRGRHGDGRSACARENGDTTAAGAVAGGGAGESR